MRWVWWNASAATTTCTTSPRTRQFFALQALGGLMIDVTPNVPEVVAEVRELFERYEQALIDKNPEVLDATFWDSPDTIRYALHENGYGFSEIHAHRGARPPGPGIKEKRIRLEILTLGRDLATVNLEFKVRGRELVGRQSQTC